MQKVLLNYLNSALFVNWPYQITRCLQGIVFFKNKCVQRIGKKEQFTRGHLWSETGNQQKKSWNKSSNKF